MSYPERWEEIRRASDFEELQKRVAELEREAQEWKRIADERTRELEQARRWSRAWKNAAAVEKEVGDIFTLECETLEGIRDALTEDLARGERVRPWLRHLQDCPGVADPLDERCTCGLRAAFVDCEPT